MENETEERVRLLELKLSEFIISATKEAAQLANNMGSLTEAVKELNITLKGSLLTKGLVGYVIEHEEYIKDQRSTKKRLLSYAYKTIIAIGLGFIAYKVGITK